MMSFNKLALGLTLLTTTLYTSSLALPSHPKKNSTRFPSVDGRLFNINGKTQYFAGTNAWWLGHLPSNADVDTAVSQIAQTGYDVVRVWGFGSTNDASTEQNIYYQVLNSSGQYFNMDPTTGNFESLIISVPSFLSIPTNSPRGIPHLDYAVAQAEKYNLKFVLPLLNQWNDLGGINTYTTAFGGNATSFYTDEKAQAAHKAYVKFIVNRYKSSPAIFAWELCNEPRCSGCNSSIITNWASNTSAYIKSLDPDHLVALGDEGWLAPPLGDGTYAYSGYEGVDFAANLAIKTIDYGTLHLYPSSWNYNYTWGSEWIQQHDAIGKSLGKPVVLEEYGSPNASTHIALTKPWQDTVVQDTEIAMDSIWQFATHLPSGTNDIDTFGIYYNSSDYKVLGHDHVTAVHAKKPA